MAMSAEEKAVMKERLRLERIAEREKKKAEMRQQWEEEKLRRKEERDKVRGRRGMWWGGEGCAGLDIATRPVALG